MMLTIYDDTLRSKESIDPAILLISNRTKRPVDILWINYAAKLIRYKTLRSGDEFQMNTFKTHPWIFRDYYTGLLMHVDHKEVFWPEASTDKRPIQHVRIHFPVQSLKTISLWACVQKVRNHNEITQMEIPQTLRNDLQTLFRQFYNHHVMLAQHAQRRQQQHRNQ
ncbi:protein Vhl [Sitodiplosis mosellana]|uniref:protein Vhl n=1 Tax=Sitodiplosis mosellana TaxID=263140 RepID=UPI002444E5EF|nr:protein Vhl [Sitodiplosis mosellana]